MSNKLNIVPFVISPSRTKAWKHHFLTNFPHRHIHTSEYNHYSNSFIQQSFQKLVYILENILKVNISRYIWCRWYPKVVLNQLNFQPLLPFLSRDLIILLIATRDRHYSIQSTSIGFCFFYSQDLEYEVHFLIFNQYCLKRVKNSLINSGKMLHEL